MAVKKTTAKASTAKAATKKAAPKKAAAKKAAVKKAAAPKKAAVKKAAPKKKAEVKLTDGQLSLLKKVAEAKEGYSGPKAETRVLEALQTKKLVKRGAKDKASGTHKYSISKAGEKKVAASGASTSSPSA